MHAQAARSRDMGSAGLARTIASQRALSFGRRTIPASPTRIGQGQNRVVRWAKIAPPPSTARLGLGNGSTSTAVVAGVDMCGYTGANVALPFESEMVPDNKYHHNSTSSQCTHHHGTSFSCTKQCSTESRKIGLRR